MNDCARVPRSQPHPETGELHEWTVISDGTPIPWRSYAGPLRLDANEFADACRKLLGIEPDELQDFALEHIETAADRASGPRLILHSTTPTTRGFETDLAAMAAGRVPGDITTYTETRALYLARPGDIAVGRTRPWRLAPTADGVERLALDDTDHYYMSHALLKRATEGGSRDPVLAKLIACLRERPATVVSLYSFEPELQALLGWLARTAGIGRIRVDTNDPRIAMLWNRKRLLHPTVDAALRLDIEGQGLTAPQLLGLEHRASEAFQILRVPIPVLPGYTIPYRDDSQAFRRDAALAAKLLAERYGLSRACFKPSEGGDGGRIVAGIDLADRARLEELTLTAWRSGGDQILEAHMEYLRRDIGGESIPIAPSVHLDGGRLLDGLTLQFLRGASWKGNVYCDESGWQALGLDPGVYSELRSTVGVLADRLGERGLVQAGVDFAVGTLGGLFGNMVVHAVQDINAKVTGALFLREFMARRPGSTTGAATRVFLPGNRTVPDTVHRRLTGADNVIAVVPGRWGMLAATAATQVEAGARVLRLEQELIDEGLAHDPLAGGYRNAL